MIPLKDDIPVSRTPVATIALIAANVAAFLWQASVGLRLSTLRGGLIPAEILTLRDLGPYPDIVPPPFTILTSMFLHGGFMHLAGNMLFLWIFGNNVEDTLGRGRFLLYYLVCGVAAALAQVLATVLGDPEGLVVPMVGASGAIAGVLAAYMLLFPHARVLTLVPIFVLIRLMYIPAGFFIGLWFVIQLVSALFSGGAGGGVAFMAHVGGFVAGWLMLRRSPLRRGRHAWRRGYW